MRNILLGLALSISLLLSCKSNSSWDKVTTATSDTTFNDITDPIYDITKDNNSHFTFSEISEEEYLRYRKSAKGYLGLRCDNEDSDCFNEVQKLLVSRSRIKITVADSCLHLEYLDSTSYDFCDNLVDGEDYMVYKLSNVFPEAGFIELVVGYYEGGAVKMVNDSTGEAFDLIGNAVLSPDKTRFIATSYDLEAQYDPNGFDILKIEDGKIRGQYDLEPTEWGPTDPVWINDNEIAMVMNQPFSKSKPVSFIKVVIKD